MLIPLTLLAASLLAVCLIGDHIIPRIPIIESYLENLPDLEDEP